MANPSKRKGTAAENMILRWVREHGFPWAELLRTAGIYDRGDVSLLPGRAVIIESKWDERTITGQVPPALLAKWMAQTAAERINAGADYAVLVVKRGGTTDAGRFWAYLTTEAFASLLGAPGPLPGGVVADSWVCTMLADACVLLRANGYGEPLEVGP